MHSFSFRLTALFGLTAMLAPIVSLAQTPATNQPAILLLRPHCTDSSTPDANSPAPTFAEFLKNGFGTCKNFTARDPQTLETQALRAGDTLEMDLIVFNPSKAPISKVRSWISYDPQTLQGFSVTLKDLPVPTPGEAEFSSNEGFLKLSANSEEGREPKSWLTNVAHVTFKITKAPRAGLTPIGFYDIQPGLSGHAYVVSDGKNIGAESLGSLLVIINPSSAPSSTGSAGSTASVASVSSVASSAAAVSSAASAASVSSGGASSVKSPFVLLQIQNLRVTTEGGTIYTAWEALPSSEVAGYNLYYGTERGRYIQRRSLNPETRADAIRNLPQNTVYYLAVRAFNAKNEETAFSREVMVKTGDPRTSTAPLSLDGIDAPSGNPLTGSVTGVPGESGAPTFAVIILGLCAVVGTALAFRRQLSASPSKK